MHSPIRLDLAVRGLAGEEVRALAHLGQASSLAVAGVYSFFLTDEISEILSFEVAVG